MAILAIRVHPRDNVAVAVADVQAGEAVRLADGTELLTVEAIPRGSKVALGPIARGEAIIRYGEEIGRATEEIAVGAYVHTHNLGRRK
jgi:altronate hydrolase